jgi:hypothetical protein
MVSGSMTMANIGSSCDRELIRWRCAWWSGIRLPAAETARVLPGHGAGTGGWLLGDSACRVVPGCGKGKTMGLVLWVIAAILVVSGIVSLFRGQMIWGIALIVLGLLVGPGGVSIFT